MPKYLLIQRSAPGEKEPPPSPAQMQEMYAVFNAWKEKFKDHRGHGRQAPPGGKMVTATGVTDGPLIEAKEIVGGYMVVAAESYEAALEVAREGPD